jgi:hypothetical protein
MLLILVECPPLGFNSGMVAAEWLLLFICLTVMVDLVAGTVRSLEEIVERRSSGKNRWRPPTEEREMRLTGLSLVSPFTRPYLGERCCSSDVRVLNSR